MSGDPALRGTLHATCPAPLANLLGMELRAMGARDVRPRGAGAAFRGDRALAYRVCLWSRIASRVLLPLLDVDAHDGDALYAGARQIDWSAHLDPHATFAVDCTVRRAKITHSHYAALRVKDAVADHFREHTGRRPDVDTRDPDLRINVHLRGARARIALDLAGQSLHRRGYRIEAGAAPLRENLAAAVLLLAGWPDAGRMPALLDPVCGAGTLLIEAALLAGDVAPGLLRERFGFHGWLRHDPDAWAELVEEARTRRERGLAALPDIRGGDRDPAAVDGARRNLERAGLGGRIALEVADLERWRDAGPFAPRGLLVANPPYGARMETGAVRERLAALVHGPFRGWTRALLVPDIPGWPGGHATSSTPVTNGALECRVDVLEPDPAGPDTPAVGVDAAPLANRIARNQRRLSPWLRREGVSCYRVYDADLPEFNLAVDLYRAGGEGWALVQEYAAPPRIEPHVSAARRDAAIAVLPEALGISPDRLVFRTRERQRGNAQYARRGAGDAPEPRLLEVEEHGARLLVNLHDYLDTGLFLDHRPVRRWIGENAAGRRFLNLFAYAGAATVHAALGGARETLSVDLSSRYLEWTRRNLARNGLAGPAHRTLRADCVEWLRERPRIGTFDLVFLDPPTFSNSKRMRASLDVQRDHVALIHDAAALLAPGGTLVFSCNRRGFRLDEAALADLECRDWTRESVPADFSRPSPPHRCWMLRRRV